MDRSTRNQANKIDFYGLNQENKRCETSTSTTNTKLNYFSYMTENK